MLQTDQDLNSNKHLYLSSHTFSSVLMQTFHPLGGTNKQSVVETHRQTYGKMDGRIVMNLFLINIKVIIFCHIFHYLIKLFFTLEN